MWISLLTISRNQLGGSEGVLKHSPNEEANFSNVATVTIVCLVEGRPILMVFPYCFSSPRVLAAEAITSLQVELALQGLVGHKLNSQPIVILFT